MVAHKAYRALSYPVVTALIGWTLAGFSFMAYPLWSELSSPNENVPFIVNFVLGFMLFASSLLAIMSTWKWKNESTAWRLELIAHPILVVSWLTVGSLILFSQSPGFLLGNMTLSFAIACALRFIDVNRSIDRARRNVEYMKRNVGGGSSA